MCIRDSPEPECHLRTVNIFTDKHVWGVLDEGCNSTCHGDEWRKNANEKFARRGEWAEGKTVPNARRKYFQGIGDGVSNGKWRFCMGIPLHKRKSIVHNVFDSHELPGTEGKPNWNPLLISRRAQGKLGLVKDLSLIHI